MTTTDEIIETMARAIWADRDDTRWADLPEHVRQANMADVRAAIEAAEAAGMVMVPREPTIGMFRALTASWARTEAGKAAAARWAIGSFTEDYRAMIAAAGRVE